MLKQIYYVTFGQRSPFSNGWVEIEASSQGAAMDEAMEVFGRHFANMYEPSSWDKTTRDFYPDGKFGRTLKAY